MRGEKSVVTKANGGFSVNGQSVATLSGSTKDILGLATRVALIKTFLPGCPFLVLDEPAQGCDSDRTGALLGFIASCGFSQVILVTHDGLSESFADNLISL
jgi:DNA repair exonuclease SbcCD ATPase subunit